MGGPVLGPPADTQSDDLTLGQRVIRNQVLTRGAPIAGRGLIAIGAAAVAIGTARSRQRRTPRVPFTVVPEKEAKRLGNYKKGRYIHYRRETVWNRRPQIDVQERNAIRRQTKPRGGLLKAGGSALVIGGKALPILAYGYVGYDLYRRQASPTEVKDEIERTTFGMTTGEAVSTIGHFASDVATVYSVAMPLLNWAFA